MQTVIVSTYDTVPDTAAVERVARARAALERAQIILEECRDEERQATTDREAEALALVSAEARAGVVAADEALEAAVAEHQVRYPPAAPTVPVLAALPRPPARQRWVGPLQPRMVGADLGPIDVGTFAGSAVGAEFTACYAPREQHGAVDARSEGWAETDTSGRACVRTREGWWVAVPAGRPSALAAHVREAGGTAEVGADGRRQPIRDEWADSRVVWRAQNLLIGAGRDEYGRPAGVEVVWCPFRPGSRAWLVTLEAAGLGTPR